MPSTVTVAWLGRSYQAIKALERMGLLDGTAARRAYRRLVIRASDEGCLVSRVDQWGKPLHKAIRIHWMGHRGHSHHRIYKDDE
jgi:hypothetical protein